MSCNCATVLGFLQQNADRFSGLLPHHQQSVSPNNRELANTGPPQRAGSQGTNLPLWHLKHRHKRLLPLTYLPRTRPIKKHPGAFKTISSHFSVHLCPFSLPDRCVPHSAPAAQATSIPPGTGASSRGCDRGAGRPSALPLPLNQRAGLPTNSSRPTLASDVVELASPRDSHRTCQMAGDEAPSLLLCGGKPKPAPASPICSPKVAGRGQAGSQSPRGLWDGAALPPVPQPEDSSRLDFILLFQPLPPATRWQKAGLSSTALKQSRGFLSF